MTKAITYTRKFWILFCIKHNDEISDEQNTQNVKCPSLIADFLNQI